MDADVAYLVGLVIARGTLQASPQRRLLVHFAHTSLEVEGIRSKFDQKTSIRLGLGEIRERVAELLGTDVRVVSGDLGADLVATFDRNSLAWRNLLLITEGSVSFPHFRVPKIFLDPSVPTDWKREFVRGYGDVGGNVRKSNNYFGRHRVRLDTLNYPTNWSVPVELCTLLQEHLAVPVQLITWGHPNLGRNFREHQLNIFAEEYLTIGFTFDHKRKILEELAEWNRKEEPGFQAKECPGQRLLKELKPDDPEEDNGDKLDARLVGRHFNAYWQICRKLGCKRRPPPGAQKTLDFVEDREK